MTLLKIENLSGNLFPSCKENITLFHNINLETKLNDVTALLQLSGTSTSFLLRMLAGQFPPTCGKIILNGTDITPTPDLPSRLKISYMTPSVILENKNQSLTLSDYFNRKKRNSLFSVFSKNKTSEYLSFLPSSFYQEDTKTLKSLTNLFPYQHILLSLLASLSEKPELLLIDTLPSLLPDEITGQAIYELSGIAAGKNIPFLFSTRSPHLAYHLAGQILPFRDEQLLPPINNTPKNPELLKKLLQLQQEASGYLPLHSPLIRSLAGQQYI